MSDAQAYHNELLSLVHDLVLAALAEYRPRLAQATGVLPGPNIPLSGPAAPGEVGTGYPPQDDSVTTDKIVDGAITTPKIADGAVTEAKLSFDPATQSELDAVQAALVAPQYLVLALSGALANERRVVAGSGISLTDGGAGSDLIVALISSPPGIPRTVGWYFDGATFVAGNDQGPNYTIDVNVTLTGVAIYAKTAPASSAADVDIQRSTNGGSTWSTIFSTRPQIAASSHTGGGAAVLSITTLNAGDIVRCDVVSAGGTAAQGVTVLLKMTTR